MSSADLAMKEIFRRRFVLIMTLLLVAIFLAVIGGFLKTLVLASIFAGILYPLYRFLERKFNGRENLASFVTLAISLVCIVVPVVILLTIIAAQAVEVSVAIKPWMQKHIELSQSSHSSLPVWLPFSEELAPYSNQIMTKTAEFAGNVGGYFASLLAKVSQGTAVFFLHLFIMLYSMFFFLTKGAIWSKQLMGYLPLSKEDRERLIEVGLSTSLATIKGTLVIGLIQGVLGGIGFAVAGIEAAVFWAAIMAVLSIIPGIGATLVWAPAVAYLFMTDQVWAGIGLLIWSIGAVSSVDNVLRPRLVGRDTKIPDLLILVSTLGGLALFGATGLILGPTAVAMVIAALSIYSRTYAEWLDIDSE